MSTATKTTRTRTRTTNRTRTANRPRTTRDPKTGRTTVDRTQPRVIHRPPPGGKGTATGQSLPARAPGLAVRGAWTHRWRLAPAAGAAAVVTGQATHPLLALAGLTVTGAGLELAARTKVKIRGRMWLSGPERRIAGIWCGAAGGWTAVTTAAPAMGWRADAALLAAALGWPTWAWVSARKPAKAKLSAAAAALVAAWADKVAGPDGPPMLRGAVALPGSVTEPVEGGVAMVVRLDGVHAANATGTQLRRAVEVAMGLPADTVALSALRDDGPADRLAVLLAPGRTLEKGPTAWPGPIIEDDGALPVALDAAAATVKIHLYNKDGVEHGLISGTSGTGKGGTTVVVIVPGVLAGRSVVLYADGKHGMSAPELHPLATRLALTSQQAGRAIDIAHAVMCARETRYGAAKLKRFVAAGPDANPDPILTLLLDEATTLNRVLSGPKIRKVCEIAERGRACGVQLIEVSQSVRSDMIIGGVPVRDLLTGAGFSIAHKPGGSSAARLASDGIQVAGLVEALQALPGDKPGMAVITRRGGVLATSCRVFDAEEAALALVAQWLGDGGRPRELTGADLAAAGELYTKGWDDDPDAGSDGAPPQAGTDAGTDEEAQAAAELESRTWVLDQLRAHGPMQLGQFEVLADPAEPGGERRGPSRKTISNALNDLAARSLLVKQGRAYKLVDDEAGDDEAEGDDQE
jgi:hypothetical protein